MRVIDIRDHLLNQLEEPEFADASPELKESVTEAVESLNREFQHHADAAVFAANLFK